MAWLNHLSLADWVSLALPLLALLLWLLEYLYRRTSGQRQPDNDPEKLLLSLNSGLSYAPEALGDDAINQRTNQPVQFLLHDHSQFIGPDAPAIAMQLLDPKAPYDVLNGYVPADLIALADTGYDLPTTATLDPASLPLTATVQPHAPWLDESLPDYSSRSQQFMRLFIAILMLAPLIYRLIFP